MLQRIFSVEMIERRTFFFLAGFCLTISLSMAASNVFLALTTLSFLHRLMRKHDDILEFYEKNRNVLRLLFFLIITVIISSLLAVEPLYSLKAALDFYLYRIMPFFITWFIVKTRRELFILLLLIVLSITLNNFASIGQVYLSNHYHLDFIDRFSGLIPYMAQATILSFMVPLLALAAAHYGKYRSILLFVLLISVVSLFFNMTRGAWLAALVTFIFLVVIYGRNLKIAAFIVILFSVIGILLYNHVPLFNARVKTITQYNIEDTERMKLITSAYNMWSDNPFFGIGFSRFRLDYKTMYILPDAKEKELEHAHNNIMHVLAETGIVGEVAFLAFWAYLFVFAFKKWREDKNPYAIFLIAVILAVHLHGLSEYTLGASRTIKIVFLALGIGLKGIDIYSENEVSGKNLAKQ